MGLGTALRRGPAKSRRRTPVRATVRRLNMLSYQLTAEKKEHTNTRTQMGHVPRSRDNVLEDRGHVRAMGVGAVAAHDGLQVKRVGLVLRALPQLRTDASKCRERPV